jgi:hypothetical protein
MLIALSYVLDLVSDLLSQISICSFFFVLHSMAYGLLGFFFSIALAVLASGQVMEPLFALDARLQSRLKGRSINNPNYLITVNTMAADTEALYGKSAPPLAISSMKSLVHPLRSSLISEPKDDCSQFPCMSTSHPVGTMYIDHSPGDEASGLHEMNRLNRNNNRSKNAYCVLSEPSKTGLQTGRGLLDPRKAMLSPDFLQKVGWRPDFVVNFQWD